MERNAGAAASFVGLACRDLGDRLHFLGMELHARMGRKRGSSVEQLREWERDIKGLSCSEPSAHAVVDLEESDAEGAASPGPCLVSK